MSPSDLESIAVIYALGFFCSLAISCSQFVSKRTAARIAILSPVWPVTAIIGAAIGARTLWRTADWKGSP